MRPRLTEDSPVDLIVSGFAEQITIWKDEDQFRAELGSDVQPSMVGFVHDPRNPSPSQYNVTGEVLQAEKRRNSVTKVDFWFLWLSALHSATRGVLSIVAREIDVLDVLAWQHRERAGLDVRHGDELSCPRG